LRDLKERAKELSCLYQVEQYLNQSGREFSEVMADVVRIVGLGWQFPEYCEASITIEDETWESCSTSEPECSLCNSIDVQGEPVGEIRVFYTQKCPDEIEGPFLEEEVRLIKSLADRLGHFILFRKIQKLGKKWRELDAMSEESKNPNWQVIVDLLRETDDSLFLRVSRKMLNFLCSIGISEAQSMLQDLDLDYEFLETGIGEVNEPGERQPTDRSLLYSGKPFELAAKYISGEEIIFYVQKWIQMEKASTFLNVLDNPRSTLSEVQDALRRFQLSDPVGIGLQGPTMKSVRVVLTQRILTEQIDFVKIAKDHVDVSFFSALMERTIMPTVSYGKLGGKAAGMLLANCILQNNGVPKDEQGGERDSTFANVKVPKTWHIASDAALHFISYNDLEEVLHQKYKPIDEVRRDYPNIVRLFLNSSFPPALVHGMASALDDFQGVPLVVRSSSLLEDRAGTAFSGKYKSLFLANQGSKKECLQAIQDAVAEIYASVFGPDPIEYRSERGVLEFDEQMGILIQEVVGTRKGKYFFPSFAGVAFSKNEFRWSPRIKREDGLVRLVPGLGTRAVDRTGDDYPALIVPGQPELRVNVANDEIIRYSPNKMDVINLDKNCFETVSIQELLKELGGNYDGLPLVFSIFKDGRFLRPVSLMLDPEKEQLFPTFEGLRGSSEFLPQMKAILKVLEDTLKTPVDVEFAHDGVNLFLLQCRPQGQSEFAPPSPIPQDIPGDDIVFTANKFVSNSHIEDIEYLVYVDPVGYGELATRDEMKTVGRAVGRLNQLLPRKRFVLMGPGRWGSRGDIRLGVNVTYADINNTAMLIEIARQKGSYVPDVSFGTHFFQDLVEAGIGYLPLYPDEEENVFSEGFLLRSENILPELVPKFAGLSDILRVVDVKKETEGRIVKILLNADLDQAVACFSEPGVEARTEVGPETGKVSKPMDYWLWRKQMVERIAQDLDYSRLGVVAMYLIGSVKNAIAGPASDIDLLVHFRGTRENQVELMNWLDGWSCCLDEVNYLKTGYRSKGLLDIHLITDEDIANRSSFAIKIGAVTDAAYKLELGPK
jgi:pyruvate, water dikinase